MILVRNTFQLKFGKAKDAKAKILDGLPIIKSEGVTGTRAYTDLTGRYYTLVLEMTFDNLGDYETKTSKAMKNKEWQDWYASFVPMVESGGREFFTIVE